MKILLTGGGTLGSVSPLIAIYEQAKKQSKDWEWFWIGTKKGVERKVVESLNIQYEWIPSAKLRRYFALQTFIEPFVFMVSFFRSLLIIINTKPDVVVGAGSFVSVPVIWAAWLFRKKIIIHQQDIKPTLSNKMTAFCATKITVSFEKSLEDYPKPKTEYTGNPVRDALLSANSEIAFSKLKLNKNYPVLLIAGGSSGAKAINEWVWGNIIELTRNINLVHLTGRDKLNKKISNINYHQVEFLQGDMFHVLNSSNLVISRAGISTITELAYLKKPTILVPMPQSHQEDNAAYFASTHSVYLYRQDQLDDRVIHQIKELLSSQTNLDKLSQRIGEMMKTGGRERLVEIIESI
jgi:UDP-N-acetylglucosamine--N-acetylmuramyl-(pentapeptide) pyrophosphoryl-undecaprenol N-acetylglucosamine transferase